MNNLVKIRVLKIAKQGYRGLAVRLPSTWTDDNNAQGSDPIGYYQVSDASLVTTLMPGDLILRLEKPKTEVIDIECADIDSMDVLIDDNEPNGKRISFPLSTNKLRQMNKK